MGFRLHILLTVLGAVILYSALWSVTIYQTRTASTILSGAIAESETSSRAVLSFQRSWLNRIRIIDSYLHRALTVEQARDQADAAKIRMDQELKRIEKSFATISEKGITSFKSQKNLRDLKDAAVFLETTQRQFIPAEGSTDASVSAEAIRTFIENVSQQEEMIHAILSDTHDANREMIRQAETPLQTAMRWWPFLLIVCIMLSSIIAWLNARFVTVTFNRLNEEVFHALYPDQKMPDKSSKEPPPNLSAMIRQLVEKNTANAALVTETISQRDESMAKIKTGLERTIADQKRQYEEKIQELSTLNKAMIGRELKMARLKQQLEELKRKTGTVDTEPV